MKKQEIPVINVGISLLILVLMTVCLMIFSVLSLENAIADQRLSQKAAQYTTAYYGAVNRIQERLSQPKKLEKEQGQEGKAGQEISLEEKVSDGQKLVVSVTLTGKKNQPYEITQWKLESSGEWEADRSLDVYKGE